MLGLECVCVCAFPWSSLLKTKPRIVTGKALPGTVLNMVIAWENTSAVQYLRKASHEHSLTQLWTERNFK
eukprot:5408021-Amphidinium_carterae.1